MRNTQAANRVGLAVAMITSLSAGCGGGGSEAAGPKDAYTEAYERCMHYGGSTPMICEAVARQQAGPQQKGNTDAQWAELEKAAEVRAREAGATEISPPARLNNVGFNVERTIEVEGGRCYDAAVAWSSGWKSAGSVMFVAKDGGKPPNENLAGKNIQLESPGGVVHFCADHPGTAKLSLSGLDGNGAILNNERLEYVVVVGARLETPADGAARRTAEAAAAEEGRARIENNLQDADFRRGGARLQTGCARCRKLYKGCMAEKKGEAAGAGADKENVDRCVLVFETCAQSLGVDPSGRVICNYP